MHIRVFVSMSNMDSYIHVIVHCHIRVCIYNACVYMYTYACIILHIHIYHQVLHHYCDKNKLVLEYKYTEEGPPHAKVCRHAYAWKHTLSHTHTYKRTHTHTHTHMEKGPPHAKVCSLRVHVYAKSLARILYHTHTHLACVRMRACIHTLFPANYTHTHTPSHIHTYTLIVFVEWVMAHVNEACYIWASTFHGLCRHDSLLYDWVMPQGI